VYYINVKMVVVLILCVGIALGIIGYALRDLISNLWEGWKDRRAKPYLSEFNRRYSGLSRRWPDADRQKEWGGSASLLDDALVLDRLSWPVGSREPRLIEGTVTNHTNLQFEILWVMFSLCDSSGKTIGYTRAKTPDVAPGEVWRFEAPVQDKTVIGVRLDAIDGAVKVFGEPAQAAE